MIAPAGVVRFARPERFFKLQHKGTRRCPCMFVIQLFFPADSPASAYLPFLRLMISRMIIAASAIAAAQIQQIRIVKLVFDMRPDSFSVCSS